MKYVVLVLLLLLGCEPAKGIRNNFKCTTYWAKDSFPVKVFADDSFSNEELNYINLAIENWNKSVGNTVFIQYSSKPVEGVSLVKTVLPGEPLGRCAKSIALDVNGITGRIKTSTVLLDTIDVQIPGNEDIYYINTASVYIAVVTHELGHALGLLHNEHDPNSVMYPIISSESTQTQLTELDVVSIRSMMKGTYKESSLFGFKSCF